jgi:hypothetical protein
MNVGSKREQMFHDAPAALGAGHLQGCHAVLRTTITFTAHRITPKWLKQSGEIRSYKILKGRFCFLQFAYSYLYLFKMEICVVNCFQFIYAQNKRIAILFSMDVVKGD